MQCSGKEKTKHKQKSETQKREALIYASFYTQETVMRTCSSPMCSLRGRRRPLGQENCFVCWYDPKSRTASAQRTLRTSRNAGSKGQVWCARRLAQDDPLWEKWGRHDQLVLELSREVIGLLWRSLGSAMPPHSCMGRFYSYSEWSQEQRRSRQRVL